MVSKKYVNENLEKIINYNKKYYQINKEQRKIIKNLELIKEQRKNYYNYKMTNDPLFRVKKNIRSLISMTIKNKGFKKSLKSEQILGCTFDEFKQHLEGLFEPWMNWNNYGNPKDGLFEPNKTWDIDHVIPTSSGLNEQQVIELNHYKNLKPLCSYVNRWIKRDII